MSLLIANTTVLTVDAGDRVIRDGAVYVEDGRIAAVGPSAEIEASHPGAARVVDGAGKFANMNLAWETLSDGMKDMLSRLEAVHSSRHVFGPGYKSSPDESDRFRNAEQAVQDAVHPVVIRHPDTGRKVLYVNPTFTVRFNGWTEEESRPLLHYLYEHASKPEFSCRVQWREGSLGLWDNRATWHLALNDYPGHRRLMHRVTIEGTTLSA